MSSLLLAYGSRLLLLLALGLLICGALRQLRRLREELATSTAGFLSRLGYRARGGALAEAAYTPGATLGPHAWDFHGVPVIFETG